MTMFIGPALIVVAMAFAVTSIFHATKNMFETKTRKIDKRLLYGHYASTVSLSLLVVIYVFPVLKVIGNDLALSAIFIAILTLVRFGLDWWDHKERRAHIDFFRPLADAGANFAVIVLAIGVIARTDFSLLWLAIFLASMLAGKELWYRTLGDLMIRKAHYVTSSQGGSVGKSSKQITSLQAFAGRYLKSLFYMTFGFGLIYLALALLYPSVRSDIPNVSPYNDALIQALGFSIKNMFAPSGWGEIPLALAIALSGQFFCALAMAWKAMSLPIVKQN